MNMSLMNIGNDDSGLRALQKCKNVIGRTRTCARLRNRFLVYRLNRSATITNHMSIFKFLGFKYVQTP